jgi:hypothetical protein
MQLDFAQTPVQLGFEQTTMVRELPLPDVRPSSDTELEVTFIRAAMAWAKWRERKRWTGR